MYAQSRPVLPPRRHHSNTNKQWLPWLFAGGALMLGFFMMIAVVSLIGVFYLTQERVPSGVTVAGIELGDKTIEEATSTLRQSAVGLNGNITAVDGDRSWQLTLADLGVRVDVPATMEAVQAARSGVEVQPRYTIDLNHAQNGLIDLSDVANIPAVPGRPPQIGRAMEIPVMLDRLRVDVTGELADGILELVMMEVEPPEITALEAYTGARTTHIVERGQELGLIARMYGVSINDIVALNEITNANLIYPGQQLVVPAEGVYAPGAGEAPAAPTNSGKAIVVSTQDQRIYAYENGQLVRSHLTSTGRAETPTVLGDYRIYVKHVATDMRGPDYFLPQVPYTMYFHRGYGIHGTYWHNSFGRPMSHGCVNLPIHEAEWFFNWAEVGTLVRVI